jgi:Zn2+/Cd2+-exporting ATPase
MTTVPSSPDTASGSRHLHLAVHGMDCAEEAALVRRALADDAGVEHLDFDLIGGRVEVVFNPEATTAGAILAAIERTGLRASAAADPLARQRVPAPPGAAAPRSDHARGAPRLLLLSGALFLVGWGIDAWHADGWIDAILGHAHVPGDADAYHREPASVAAYGMALLVGLWPTWPRALASLRYRRLDMHVLVCVSAIGAAVIGQWSEAAAVAFLFALAHWI